MRPKIITFDCYGTLIDWDLGIARAFEREAARQGRALDAAAALRAYHEAEARVEASGFRLYREVLAEAAEVAAAGLGWPLPPGRRHFLAEDLPSWPPFPDTNPALRRLRGAGYRLGILSNVDDDLLAGTLRHLAAEFDLLVTAQQVRSYKPAPGHFRRALERVGGDPERIVHVARSYYHDVRTAVGLGIPTVWVNRSGEARPPEGPAPAAEVADLSGAADWIRTRFRGAG